MYLLKQKSHWLAAFDALTTRLGRHPLIIRTDNAKELSTYGATTKDYFTKYIIFNEKCSPHEHDHWQNPVAEAIVGTLSM